jgi:hypothetical protein
VKYLLLAFATSLAFAQTAASPSAEQIIRKSLQRDFFDFNSVKNYTYVQREETRIFEHWDKPPKIESVTHEVLILSGSPYEKRIAKNDKALDEQDARHEQDKLDKEAAKRQHMSAGERAKIEKERAKERDYLREIADAFDFKLAGEETISGLPAWVIEAAPKAGYKPTHSGAKIFAKIHGKIWIDQREYHWVKMAATIDDSLTRGLGLLKIEPGAAAKFEQKRINDEVWLPSHLELRGEARVAFLKKLRVEIDITYRDYRKFSSDSKIVTTEEK